MDAIENAKNISFAPSVFRYNKAARRDGWTLLLVWLVYPFFLWLGAAYAKGTFTDPTSGFARLYRIEPIVSVVMLFGWVLMSGFAYFHLRSRQENIVLTKEGIETYRASQSVRPRFAWSELSQVQVIRDDHGWKHRQMLRFIVSGKRRPVFCIDNQIENWSELLAAVQKQLTRLNLKPIEFV